MTAFNLNYFLKTQPPYTVTLEVRDSNYEFWSTIKSILLSFYSFPFLNNSIQKSCVVAKPVRHEIKAWVRIDCRGSMQHGRVPVVQGEMGKQPHCRGKEQRGTGVNGQLGRKGHPCRGCWAESPSWVTGALAWRPGLHPQRSLARVSGRQQSKEGMCVEGAAAHRESGAGEVRGSCRRTVGLSTAAGDKGIMVAAWPRWSECDGIRRICMRGKGSAANETGSQERNK